MSAHVLLNLLNELSKEIKCEVINISERERVCCGHWPRVPRAVQFYNFRVLTLKAPRKKMHLKMSSAEVVCCK